MVRARAPAMATRSRGVAAMPPAARPNDARHAHGDPPSDWVWSPLRRRWSHCIRRVRERVRWLGSAPTHHVRTTFDRAMIHTSESTMPIAVAPQFVVLAFTVSLASVGTTALPAQTPAPRNSHVMTTAGPNGGVLLFGGGSTGAPRLTDTLWSWAGTVWSALSSSGPHSRTLPGAAFD